MGREVVKELIQHAAHYDAIAEELDQLLNNRAYRERVLADYDALTAIMGEPGASLKVAQLIVKYLR